MEEYFKRVTSINVNIENNKVRKLTYTLDTGKTIETEDPSLDSIQYIQELANNWVKEDIKNNHKLFPVGTKVITTVGRGTVVSVHPTYARFNVQLAKPVNGVSIKSFPCYEMVLDHVTLEDDCTYRVADRMNADWVFPEYFYMLGAVYNQDEHTVYIKGCTKNNPNKTTPNFMFAWKYNKDLKYLKVSDDIRVDDLVITPEGVGKVAYIHRSDVNDAVAVLLHSTDFDISGNTFVSGRCEVFALKDVVPLFSARLKLNGCYDYNGSDTTRRIVITDIRCSKQGFDGKTNSGLVYKFLSENCAGEFESNSYMERNLTQVTSETH